MDYEWVYIDVILIYPVYILLIDTKFALSNELDFILFINKKLIMRKFLFLLPMIVVIIISSCSNEDTINNSIPPNKKNLTEFTEEEKAILANVLNEHHTISIDDAQKKAEEAMTFLISQHTNSVRSSSKKSRVLSVQVIEKQKAKLRSTVDDAIEAILPDTIVYVFNFEEGYAMIAADERIEEPVLACTNLGTIPEETIEDEALGFFLDNAGEYIVNQLKTAQARQDSIMDIITAKLEETLPSEYLEEDEETQTRGLFRSKKKYTVAVTNTPIDNWEIISSKGYYVPVEWSQQAPYWNNVKDKKSCGTVRTGCVATAAAQIIAYWKYPSSIDGVTFDWNGLTRKPYIIASGDEDIPLRGQVAHLMERIGKNTNMDYGCSSSGTKTYKARNYLNRLGYLGGSESKYNTGTVQNSLDNGRPILARGDRTFKYIKIFGKKIGYTTNGHAWVIDGYVKKKRLMKQTVTTRDRKSGRIISQNSNNYYEYSSFIHNNWGWNGNNNGWFADGCFDSERSQVADPNTKSIDSDEDDYDEAGSSGNYQYNNKIYHNLVPINR